MAQSIAFASASRLHGDLAAVRKGFLVVLAAIALATLPLFTLVALESATVLHIVYGAKWVEAAPYMTALAFSIPFISMGAITAAILRGTGGDRGRTAHPAGRRCCLVQWLPDLATMHP